MINYVILYLVEFQDCHECALRNFHRSDLTHPLLTLLLFLQELSLTADITTITLRGHILTDSLHGLTGNDLCSDSCLDSDVELLAWDEFLEVLTHLAAEIVAVISVVGCIFFVRRDREDAEACTADVNVDRRNK